MENSNLSYISDEYVFDRSLYESTLPTTKGVLRVVKGPIAEWDKLNRNKRMYTEKLWDMVLESPYVKEQLTYHTLYGEANHPVDRYEVDFERVSHSIVEMWKVPAENQIYGTIYILDTPFGRILNTLYEAGGVLGYSTRAGGVLNKRNGYTEVDEKTYNFITLDAVPYPSVAVARPETVSEGTIIPTKVELSEECHANLIKIINESSKKDKESIKDLIYNLEYYDLSREVALLEGKSVEDEPDTSCSVVSQIDETTKFLLKENAVQIDTLKADNATLQATNEAIRSENIKLKSNLESSLRKISNLMESASIEPKVVTVTKTKTVEDSSKVDELTNTIRGLENKIAKLNEEIQDKDFELEDLSEAYKVYTMVKDENIGLRSQLRSVEDSSYEDVKLSADKEKELNECYEELANTLKEITELQAKLQDSSREQVRLENLVEGYEKTIRELTDSVNESSASVMESSSYITSLERQVEKLTREKEDITEGAEERDSYMNTIKRDLVSVIASNYGLLAEDVIRKLPVGFTKSDVYVVCEQLHNNSSSDSLSVVAVAESVVSGETNNRESSIAINKSNIGMSFSSNRRGVGVI